MLKVQWARAAELPRIIIPSHSGETTLHFSSMYYFIIYVTLVFPIFIAYILVNACLNMSLLKIETTLVASIGTL